MSGFTTENYPPCPDCGGQLANQSFGNIPEKVTCIACGWHGEWGEGRTENTEKETWLFFLDEKVKIHFGLGYNVSLPGGWVLKEDPHEFTLGISPHGQEYYLGDLHAFPRRWNVEGYFYLDKDNGVINLRQGEVSR